MTRKRFDPDVTRKDDGPYWGATLVMALRDGNAERVEVAKMQLRRLGFLLTTADKHKPSRRREVAHV